MSQTTLLEMGSPELSIAPLKVAVEGCCHGSLNFIYSSLDEACRSKGWSLAEIDLLIICGDFQAVRNERDLNCMSIPRRYRSIGDFHQYYSDAKQAPVLTIVIGGNHEASNYLSELYYGGWLAPKIYYLGAVGVIRYGPFRIAGVSGIFNNSDYQKPHHERLPYDRDEIRSIYHVRQFNVSKLLQLRSPLDVGISHDWPRRVEWFGDYKKLFAERPSFFESAKIDNLGSPPAEQIMNFLRPRYWFSGHMHVRYSATVKHREDTIEDAFDGLTISDEFRTHLPRSMLVSASKRKGSTPKSLPPDIKNSITHFLALDKPGQGREFLELLELDETCRSGDASNTPYMQKTPQGKFMLHYDEEWLSIIRSSEHSLVHDEMESLNIPSERPSTPSKDTVSPNLDWVQTHITSKGLLKIPETFEKHAPVYDPLETVQATEQPDEFPNSQTERFCMMLQIQNRFSVGKEEVEDEDYIAFE